MTQRVMHDLGCSCGRHFRRALYHALDVTAQPGLRYAVLAGVLNVVQCPSCERSAQVALPFLYSDGARGRLILVYPGDGEPSEEAQGQIAPLMSLLGDDERLQDRPRPTVLYGLDRLAALIEADLDEGERPGAVLFDVRPGIRPERAARLLAGRIAHGTGGYVHSWREGGRLHLQVLGPSSRLQELTVLVE